VHQEEGQAVDQQERRDQCENPADDECRAHGSLPRGDSVIAVGVSF
jgi:hypothetical protein